MMFFAGPPANLWFLAFVGLVPILKFLIRGESSLKKSLLGIFLFTLIWNSLSNQWVFDASFSAGILVTLINSIYISVPFVILRMSIALKLKYSTLLFVLCFLVMEYLHTDWILAFPFLNLGYLLAESISLIQFYQFTGWIGGSLWIVVTNVYFLNLLQYWNSSKRIRWISGLFVLILVPILISLFIQNFSDTGSEGNMKVLTVHTDLNCKTEKYKYSSEELVYKYLDAIKNELSPDIDLVVWPETAITNLDRINTLNQNNMLDILYNELLTEYPELIIVSGAIMYEFISDHTEYRNNPNIVVDSQYHYKIYNSVIEFNSNYETKYRVKEKLVPLEETIPNNVFVRFFDNVFKSLGGFTFSKKYTENLFVSNEMTYGALICYESVFPQLISEFVLEGAQFLVVISNEGWFNNEAGSKRFLNAAIVASVETNRSIVKSTNQGITSIIDRNGRLVEKKQNVQTSGLIGDIDLNNKITFSTRYSGWMGKMIIALVLLLVVVQLMEYLRRTKFLKLKN